MPTFPSTLSKEERIYSKKLIEALFQGGRSRSMSAFPLRVVYMLHETHSEETAVGPRSRFLISVPKRCFKRAVKRNRVKRQVREAYRHHKSIVAEYPVALAFIWLDNRLRSSEDVDARMISLLRRVAERISGTEKARPADQPQTTQDGTTTISETNPSANVVEKEERS